MITRAKAYELRKLIEKASVSLDDEDALNGVELYPAWEPDTDYEVDGKRLRYIDKLYKVRQAHHSQAQYTPDITPALYELVVAGHSGAADDPIPFDLGMAIFGACTMTLCLISAWQSKKDCITQNIWCDTNVSGTA